MPDFADRYNPGMAFSFTRRQLSLGGVGLLGAQTGTRGAGLCLNEDCNHFFYTRAGRRITSGEVDAWVDQYAGTQVRELMLNVNAMRTSYASSVWDPWWRGYDPNAGDDQPLFASLAPDARKVMRGWIHAAWQLNQDGIDIYARWISRARRHGLSPWISMRMNDVHNADDERSPMHNEFWRSHPEFRRVRYRSAALTDRALDYARTEVYEHAMQLVRELAARYDFDGLELDWMRFGFHFRPGFESEGAAILTRFTTEVRGLLDGWEKKRGHRIQLGARVASRPATALGLGMDAAAWAREGLIDLLVVTPFWATIEPDMPIEEWTGLLRGTKTTLAAGLEVLLRAHPDARPYLNNSLETVRGAASALLDRGADRVYLFNYMDLNLPAEMKNDYPALLREAGSLATMAGKPRRHVLTYPDTWAPGEARAIPLPAECRKDQWLAFRLPVGPKPQTGRALALLAIEGVEPEQLRGWRVLVNGAPCASRGSVVLDKPCPPMPAFAFDVPAAALNRGYNVIEVQPQGQGRVLWVELAIRG